MPETCASIARSSRRMTDLAKIFTPLTCTLAAFASMQTACAQPGGVQPAPLSTDFDLAHHGPQDETVRHRVDQQLEESRFSKGKLGPHVTFSPMSGGPTLEFGAFGAGRKGTPGLAHVGVDWRF